MRSKETVDKVSIIATLWNEGIEATRNLTDEIISHLPEDKQHGNLVATQADAIHYVSIVAGVICIFGTLYNIYNRLAMTLDVKIYSRVNINRQDRVLNTFTNLTCMSVIVSMAFFYLFNIESPDGGKFGWFKSNLTMMEVQPTHGVMMVWMAGFFLYDEIVLRCVYTDPYADGDKVTMQHSMHHWFGIIYMLTALFVGYAMPSSIAMGLMSEFSTIWLNFRFLLDERESKLSLAVNLMFALSYTVLRIGFLPYGLVLMWSFGIGIWHRLNTFRRVCLVINLLVATLI